MRHYQAAKTILLILSGIRDDDKESNSLEKKKIVLSLVLVILAIASVFALIAIKLNGYTKTGNQRDL